MASSAMVMGASVYFILRTQQLEKDYLNSIEQKQIDKNTGCTTSPLKRATFC